MNCNIWEDFQIYISVSLNSARQEFCTFLQNDLLIIVSAIDYEKHLKILVSEVNLTIFFQSD